MGIQNKSRRDAGATERTQGMDDTTVTIEDGARLSGAAYETFRKRLQRRRVVLFQDPEHKQRKRMRLSDLDVAAQQLYHKEQAEKKVAALNAPPDPMKQPLVALSPEKQILRSAQNDRLAVVKSPQPMLQFQPQIPTQEAIDQAIAAVPAARRAYVERWCEVVGMCVNGTFAKYKSTLIGGRTVETKTDFIKWLADQNNVSLRDVHRKVALYNSIKKQPSLAGDEKTIFKAFVERLLPKPKTGRQSIFQKPGNEWMWLTLRNFYVSQAQYSVIRAHSLLMEEIDEKQRAHKLGHLYEDRPSLRQCRIALKNLPMPEEILGRLGEKAYNDKCAPYISRDPESIRSNDIWVTDQKQIDVRLRGAGEQLGRIWMVSFFDARSWRVMGYWFGPILSSDMVISAAAVAISRHGVPKSILMDLGKEFQCTAFNGGFRKIKGETLLREAQGLCQRLGIEVINAIGRNPQTKPIERWHDVASEFDKRIPGWCGRNTDERPEVLAEFERQHEEWKSTGRGQSPLWTIHQYLHALVNWVENTWNAEHRGRGKYLRGMTPNECWNTHLPEGGVRRITEAELELAAAEHRVLKVARGGQINITIYGQTLEYSHPALFLRQGQELEVILSRRALRAIAVLDKASDGRFLCEATAKPLFHWGQRQPEDREELRQAIRIRNAAKKAISLGNAARRVLEVAATPVEIGPQHPPMREISSMEFKMKKIRLARAPKTPVVGDLARRAIEMQEE